jgi:3-deoxy-D-manno-octulosonic-acid transferase
MYFFYSSLLAFGLLFSLPYWLLEMARHGKYKSGFGERFGSVPQRIKTNANLPVIWIHAVSVGEVLAIAELAENLQKLGNGYRVLVSTTTDAGQALARRRFGEDNVFYFPLDFEFSILPYLKALRPQLIVLAETEFWPNFLRLGKRSGAGIAVVNARISDRSLPGYRRWRRVLRRILTNVDVFLAQSEADATRLAEIGGSPDRIRVSGNLKFDVSAPPFVPLVATLQEVFKQGNAGPVIVCGSTVEGEETMLLRAFEDVITNHPRAVMILAPRSPERFDKVANMLDEMQVRHWRRSHWKNAGVLPNDLPGGVILLDTIGELAAAYALADIAFVGGSLEAYGGHNILEPAQHGVAIVVGRYTENFRDMIALFERHNAIRIVGPTELSPVWMELLTDEKSRTALGRNAAETVHSQTGATQKTLEALTGLLKARPS